MAIQRALFISFVVANEAIAAVTRVERPHLQKRQHAHQVVKLPDWHYVNETTPGARQDGSSGVILEPDLVPGTTGKDGAQVTKLRIGPYSVKSGQSRVFPVLSFAPPCRDCWITAMQLGLEYADGRSANTDTGAWYVSHVCQNSNLTSIKVPSY
jgi:hypothetical protein